MIEGWIQTYAGKKFRPLAARPEDVDINDIAHALALKCRFNGHCNEFYSVAEHSLRVSQLLESQSQNQTLALWGLMHDAAEAYLPDLGGPIKSNFHIHHKTVPDKIESFSEAEDRLLETIAHALRFPPIDYEKIRSADLQLLVTEARDLLGGQTESWQVAEAPLQEKILPLPWQQAQSAFLARFHQLHPTPP